MSKRGTHSLINPQDELSVFVASSLAQVTRQIVKKTFLWVDKTHGIIPIHTVIYNIFQIKNQIKTHTHTQCTKSPCTLVGHNAH